MELDALKTIWLKTAKDQLTAQELNKEDILLAIEQKSNTVISKIRKRLTLKIWMQSLIGVIGICLAVFLLSKGERLIGVVYFFVFLLLLGLAIHKFQHYRLIVEFQKSSAPVRATILRIIEIMQKVIFAQILTTVALAVVFAILFSYLSLEKIDKLAGWLQGLIVLAIAIGTPGIFYLIAKRGQHKMFGKYLQTLREYLHELEFENELKP
ncbi:MAG: hypothetical protein ABJP45_03900 [Cyclobacteriaceae bacterium]